MILTRQHLSVLFILLAFCAIAVSSCSTARGVGRDVQHLGTGIERAAR